jgi:alkylated DNA repair dioxygenase AlkB
MSNPSRRRVRPSSSPGEADLFGAPSAMPEGFRYHPNLLSADEEEALAGELAALPFKPFDFHGYQANRQVVGFGYRYDYDRRAVVEAQPLPMFLEPLRAKIARSFDRPADAFTQVLINEYRPGAGIGWHRDKPQFDEVVGVSLLSPCVFRFRRRSGETWDRRSLTVEPRSAYLLTGPSRAVWEHSIPALDRHRYSITFRTLTAKAAAEQASRSDEGPLAPPPAH